MTIKASSCLVHRIFGDRGGFHRLKKRIIIINPPSASLIGFKATSWKEGFPSLPVASLNIDGPPFLMLFFFDSLPALDSLSASFTSPVLTDGLALPSKSFSRTLPRGPCLTPFFSLPLFSTLPFFCLMLMTGMDSPLPHLV